MTTILTGVMRAVTLGVMTLAMISCKPASQSREPQSRAARITSPSQLIGGNAARGEVGDYLLENEHARFIIQDKTYNRGSGLFGGSLIDADLKRLNDRGDLINLTGRDSFGEMFPAFFLEVVDPEQIEVINDGSDGGAAIVEVSGRGGEFVTMLRLFNQVMVNSYDATRNIGRALQGQPPDLGLEPQVAFSVRYILEPNARAIRIENTLRNVSFKTLEFPNRGLLNTLSGFLDIDLSTFTVPAGAVLGFGKSNAPFLPGIGYDLQFGLLDQVTSKPFELPALPGHLTPLVASSSDQGVSYGMMMGFAEGDPLTVAQREHFVYAKDQQRDGQGRPYYQGEARPDDMLFLFYASGFGGVFTHQLPPQLAPSYCEGESAQVVCEALFPATCDTLLCTRGRNDCLSGFDACQATRSAGMPSEFTFTHYLIVGDGDVASIWDEHYKIRGVATQQVAGRMREGLVGGFAGEGEQLLIYQAREDASKRCVVEGEGATQLGPRIYSQAQTKREGVFRFDLPPGHYCYRTRRAGRPLSALVPFEVRADAPLYLEPVVEPWGTIEVSVRDATGQPMPGKVTAVATHPFAGEGREPRAFLFDLAAGEPWRNTDFIPDRADDPMTRRYIEGIAMAGADGSARLHVRPGTYQVYLSRGPEYEAEVREITVAPGGIAAVQAMLTRSVDTTGYLNGDFHMHAEGSIDSGLSYDKRVLSMTAEGLEVVVSSDHNYVADYAPHILKNRMEPWIKSVIGLELTTFEAGHFNGFPVRYDVESASRGSFAWQQKPPGLIFEELRLMGELGPEHVVIQVNHPRDSVLGYFSQHNVNTFDTTVDLPFNTAAPSDRLFATIAAANGPEFYTIEGNRFRTTFSWNFDAIEVFNGKRDELLRHFRADRQTLRPVYIDHFTERALDATQGYDVEACETARAAIDAGSCDACAAEQATVAQCDTAEQAAEQLGTTQADAQLAALGDGKVIVCDGDNVAHPGHLDDWYNLLNTERPFTVQPYEEEAIRDPARLEAYRAATYRKYTATGNSDSHQSGGNDEPGYPRNYFFVGHDEPQRMRAMALVEAMKSHHNIVTNGPFINMTINDAVVGSEVRSPDGAVRVAMLVRAAGWVGADRWRLIANGEVVREGAVELVRGEWRGEVTLNVVEDTWFVLEVEGDRSMFPVLLTNEIPPLDIASALGSLAEPFGFGGGPAGLEPELTNVVKPFAFTNPIWVVRQGDSFTPPNPPQAVCRSGVLQPAPPNAIVAPHRPLGSRRLDAVTMPFTMHYDHPMSRLKGEMRDVRLLFEGFAHGH